MNSPLPRGVQPLHPAGAPVPPLPGPGEAEELGLFEWLGNLWEGRWLVAGALAFFVAVGGFYVWRAAPVYQVQAMLQVVPRKEGAATDPGFARLEGYLSQPAEAQSEIEILQSNLVLGRTVEALGLDLVASPRLFPVIGEALHRHDPEVPRLEVARFEVPDSLRGQTFRIRALPGGRFQLESPKGAVLASGMPGEVLSLVYAGDPVQLSVKSLRGAPGQVFTLARKPLVEAMAALRANLDVAEKGKLSNVLGLTLKSPDPSLGARTLNEIINQYTLHRIERKNAAAARTLALLQSQLPQVKARLDAAEQRLSDFRTRTGAVDVSREGDVYLQQSATLGGQISALEQRKQELLRTYKEGSDVVSTLNQQISQLKGENARIEGRLRALPGAQQEVVRLSRDVQVDTDLYTSLLNNIQQLQVASAGEVGSVAVVDPATPDPDPIAPRRTMLLGLFTFLGLLVGLGLVIFRKALSRGVEDHRLLEARLGLPVLVTVPHSRAQEGLGRALAGGEDGLHLLAAQNPEDLATESLRSLRTMLHFSLKDAGSNVIMVTGPAPSVGKSFTSANLAAVLAQAGNRVLVVDADLRKGALHRYFWARDRSGGLSDILARLADREAVTHATEVPGLDLIMSGSIPQNPSELLLGDAFGEFLAGASKAYDFVILDAPPVLAVTDPAIIGAKAGCVLVVAKYGAHPMDELRTCVRQLSSHGIRAAGWVFNDVQALPMPLGASSYRYAYHYRYD